MMNKHIKPVIRELSKSVDLIKSVEIIRKAFSTVANEFNLTRQNCPTNPAFITIQRLNKLKEKNARFFGLFLNSNLIGFIALEKSRDDPETFFMEKLAVLPEYRHRGYGKMLIDFITDYLYKIGGKNISIGVMDNNIVLKNWYKTLGFKQTSIKKFNHLPFTVCFMRKIL